MRFNSSIITNKKKLACGCFDYNFSKNRCKYHANIQDTLARFEKVVDKELEEDKLSDLVKECDEIISLYVRLKYADENGLVQCYTCPVILPYQQMQAGHYVGRANLHLRWDTNRNIRVQCHTCNCNKHGNLGVFAQNLEKEHPGLPDILMEETAIIYKPSRDELRQIILQHKPLVRRLKSKLHS